MLGAGGFYSELRRIRDAAFATKVDPAGTGVEYSTYIGGRGYEAEHSLKLLRF
jgi:hypothetical protein